MDQTKFVPAPKSRKQWRALSARFELSIWRGSEGCGFMAYLPTGIKLHVAVPFVLIPGSEYEAKKRQLAEYGLSLQWCTLFLVEGYHHPKGSGVYCLTRPPDDWWTDEEKQAGYWRKE